MRGSPPDRPATACRAFRRRDLRPLERQPASSCRRPLPGADRQTSSPIGRFARTRACGCEFMYGCPDGPHGDALPSALERSRPPRTLRTRPLFGLQPFLWNSLARSARSRAPAAGSGRRRTSCNRDRDPAGPHGTRPAQLHAPASSAFATAPVRPLLPPPPPRPPQMRGSSEPPFPRRHRTACCGESPSRRRVRRTGLECPGNLFLPVSSPPPSRPCSRTARTPPSDRRRIGTGSA